MDQQTFLIMANSINSMTNKDELEDLKQKLDNDWKIVSSAKYKHRDLVAKKRAELEAILNLQIESEFGATTNELEAKWECILSLSKLIDEKIGLMRETVYPVGTVMISWIKCWFPTGVGYDKFAKWVKVSEALPSQIRNSVSYGNREPAERGIIEQWGPTSKYPRNMGSYRIPETGDTIIRHLKKDGKPGLLFHIYKDKDRETFGAKWYPEGEDPNGT